LRVRLIALVYEALIVTAVLFVATGLFTVAFGDSREQPMHFFLQAFLFLVAGVYFVGSWTGGRRTLPMRTWRMRLVDESGRNLGLARASRRYVLAAFGMILGGVGILWAFVDRDRQFLHDRLGGTRLVSDQPATKP
jgi:uncharacterized RDD family membrane protein YckC